jgi:hypothetical protein
MEDRGDSYDSKALANAPSGEEMKRQTAFHQWPAFLFVNSQCDRRNRGFTQMRRINTDYQ